MSDQPYKSPPITEAVIEIRFADALAEGEVEKVSRDVSAAYPHRETLKNVTTQIGVPPDLDQPPTTQFNQQIGHRLASHDFTELLVLWPSLFVISQLAPYQGWGAFFSRFERDWTRWKKTVGYRKIIRVGVRFVNRIDIPVQGEGATIEEPDYLNVYAKYPKMISKVTGYAVQFTAPIEDIGCKLIVNSAGVQSPLLNHLAIMFDQDIARDADCPQSDDDLYKLLNQIRVKKNAVFEACITDRARELFQQ
jgi:uncharacterized protein (TIGR04255 family)